MHTSSQLHKICISAVILYLVLPNILFLLGWVQYWYAVPAVLLLIAGTIVTCCNISPMPRRITKKDWGGICIAILICLIMVESLGYTGRVPQSMDFLARNSIYETLVRCDWPLKSNVGDYFVYYHIFYLPPAVISKLCGGLEYAQHIIYLWTFVGFALLAFILQLKYGGKKGCVAFAIFVSLGFLTEWVKVIERSPINLELFPDAIQHGVNYFASTSYVSIWRGLAIDSPHHAIPLGMCFALIVTKQIQIRHIFFVSSLVVLHSPYAAIFLFIFILIKYQRWIFSKEKIMTWFKGITWTCLPLMIAIVVYVMSHDGKSLDMRWEDFNGLYLLRVLSLLLPCYLFLHRKYHKTSCYIAIIIFAFIFPLTPKLYSLKASAVLSCCQAFLFISLLMHTKGLRRTLTILFLLLSSPYAILHTLYQATQYTIDEKQQESNRRLEWAGHLNHPQHVYYTNFFTKTPSSPILYKEDGESAKFCLSPIATGIRSSDDPQ